MYLLPLFENTNARKFKRRTIYHETVIYRKSLVSKQNDSEIQPVAGGSLTPAASSPKNKPALVTPGRFGNQTKSMTAGNLKADEYTKSNIMKSMTTSKLVAESRLMPRDFASTQNQKQEPDRKQGLSFENKEFRNTGDRSDQFNIAENSDWDDYQSGDIPPRQAQSNKEMLPEAGDGLDKLYTSAIGSYLARTSKQDPNKL